MNRNISASVSVQAERAWQDFLTLPKTVIPGISNTFGVVLIKKSKIFNECIPHENFCHPEIYRSISTKELKILQFLNSTEISVWSRFFIV